MGHVILITGASSGIGRLSAHALADAGHTVYASMRATTAGNAGKVEAARTYAAERSVDLRTVELDIQDQGSVDGAVAAVMKDAGRLDVLIHNAGHMVFGPAEAFTPDQYAALYDVNVIGAQRLNRAALPHMRAARQGLVIWVSSSSTAGGTPPYLAPYFAAKAAMDSLAVSYAGELARWGIETTIVVPGIFTSGTDHFKDAGHPHDAARLAAYAEGPYKGFEEVLKKGDEIVLPRDADVSEVARAMVRVVDTPFGQRPFRVTIDPADGGAEVVNMMRDRMRADLLFRIGLGDLLRPRS